LTWRNLSLAFLILSATSACVHGSTPPAINSYCAIAKPIYYDSRADSAKTVGQVEAHNSTWACLCEADCPKQP
jgi:hypothetical protein